MAAPGETDLGKMLETLSVVRRPGVFTYVSVEELTTGLLDVAHATIQEDRSTTVILPVEAAERSGHRIPVRLAWLTLTVESSLEAVGLTAEVSRMLTEERISCNVIAGYHHDHVLVPVGRADDAIDALTA
jgi:hypothetical protein